MRCQAAIGTIILAFAAPCWADSTATFATHAQAGAAYSNYVATLQSKLLATAAVAKFYLSRIKGDARHSDLAAFRKDSQDLLTAAQNANNDLAALAPDVPLAAADSQYFDSARDAAQAVTSADLDIAMDLAGSPNIGANVKADMAAATTKVPQLRRKFATTVLHGYQNFGHPPMDINPSTLALKR